MLKFFCFQSPTVVNVVMREEMQVENFALNMRELMLVSNYVFTPGLRPHLSVAVAGAGWLIVSMTTSFVQIFLTTFCREMRFKLLVCLYKGDQKKRMS